MTVFRFDLLSGSKIIYDHLTDGIMWAQGLFSDSVKISLGTFQYGQLVFFYPPHSIKFRLKKEPIFFSFFFFVMPPQRITIFPGELSYSERR